MHSLFCIILANSRHPDMTFWVFSVKDRILFEFLFSILVSGEYFINYLEGRLKWMFFSAHVQALSGSLFPDVKGYKPNQAIG